jgi:hypothetical protein
MLVKSQLFGFMTTFHFTRSSWRGNGAAGFPLVGFLRFRGRKGWWQLGAWKRSWQDVWEISTTEIGEKQ